MSRISRRELKKDEFASEVTRTWEVVQQRREMLIRYGVAVVVLAILIFGGYYGYQYRRDKASEELGHAFRVYYAQVPAPMNETEPDLKFADAKAKYTEADREFAAIADRYSLMHAGVVAKYYQGLSDEQLGKSGDAERILKEVVDKNDAQISPLAKYALAGMYANSGKTDQAEKLYRDLADHSTESVPKDTALLALADVLAPKNPAEAQKILVSLKQQNPNGSAASIVDQRLAELKKQ